MSDLLYAGWGAAITCISGLVGGAVTNIPQAYFGIALASTTTLALGLYMAGEDDDE